MSSKLDSMSTDANGSSPALPDVAPVEEASSTQTAAKPDQAAKVPSWHIFIRTAKEHEIRERFAGDVADILSRNGLDKYCALLLLEPDNLIDSGDLDRVFSALLELNPDRTKDVMLILLSRGGSIEPAYQISKLCKSFAAARFIVVVPRHAKSAATLIAIGAD